LSIFVLYTSKASKVHRIENFFVSDFELFTISLLVLLKYLDFEKKNFKIGPLMGEI
jgi:hypothetical protein